MLPSTPPKAVAVDVVAAESTEADRAAIAHLSEPLRFSPNGTDFIDTGLKLAAPPATATAPEAVPIELPAQDDALRSAGKRTKARSRSSAAKPRKAPSGARRR